MPISRDRAEFGGKKFSKDKLSPGRYKCVVTDVRTSDTRSAGEGFFVDFEVVEPLTGESPVGTPSSYAIFPSNAKGSVKVPVKKAQALEEGKFIVAVAACMGKTRDEVEFITQARLDAAMKRPVSPLKGRHILVISVPYTNKKGEDTSYYELEPWTDDAAEAEDAQAPAAKPAKKSAPKPAPKAAPKKFQPPEGWELAGQDADGDDYYWNEETNETAYEADLK